ncbi:hypothetical protein EXIGLDRAFT_833024 [Exidia glandulosa HHB12029]|uniref:Uncharacterized protein n=1 Tax=Exidia glandulosa HHB12029 TaxID=1314781 RepID=A0A165L0C9_EXIGL|nr:hypothetical protein EXIGLDRAFT_833024 [Exidia glandulosa HHB12029]
MLRRHNTPRSRRDLTRLADLECRFSNCRSVLTRSLDITREHYELKCREHGLVAVDGNGGVVYLGMNTSHCTHPACGKRRRSGCSLNLCSTHCINVPVDCGAREHDNERLSRPYAFDFRLPVRAPTAFSKVTVEITFTNKDIVLDHDAIAVHNTLSLTFQPEELYAALRITDINPESMTWFDGSSFVPIQLGTTVPVFGGLVQFQVTGNDDMAVGFPLLHFLDMERGLRIYKDKRGAGLSVRDAFAAAFPDCDAEAEANDNYMTLLWTTLLDAPAAVTRRYFRAGRTVDGLWARFVQEAQRVSPSPAPRPLKRRHDDDDEEDDNGSKGHPHKKKKISQLLDEANILSKRPSWQGPPASEAGGSRSRR